MTVRKPQAGLHTLAAGLLLAAMTVAAYVPVVHAGFIWDDDAYVTENATLRSFEGLRRIWFEPGAVPQYYPLTFTTLWLEYRLWGLEPLGYHAVNVLLHAATAVLLWLALRRLRVPGAWMAAAIFAVHPMMVESVAWITERKNVLSGCLALGAFLLYLRAAPPAGRVSRPAYLGACVLFVAALLSKTVTCSLPAVLVLVLWWRHGTIDRRTVTLLAPMFVIGLGLAMVTIWVEREHVGALGDEWALSFVERVLVAGRVLWFYPRTLLWPHDLAFIYPRWAIDAEVWWQYLFPIAAAGTVVALYLARHRIGRGALVAVLCYAGMLTPALGFFNVYPMRYSFVADHFAYLPSIALIVLATGAATDAMQRYAPGRAWVRSAVGGPVLLLLAVLTARQTTIYYDLRTLWADTLAKNPECWMAHNNFGMLLIAEGNVDQGVAHYREAIRLKPDFAEAYNNLAAALTSQGKDDEAIEALREAIRSQPSYAGAYSNLGAVLQGKGQIETAVGLYLLALQIQPGHLDTRQNLGLALAALGRAEEGIAQLEAVVRERPDLPDAHTNLANVLRAQGRLAEATTHYSEVLRLQPGRAEAYNNLGVALAMQGRTGEALAYFEHAVRLNPDYAEARSNTANVLQAQGRLDAAIAQYDEALRLQPDNANTHNNLGLALLAQGKREAAIMHFQEALRLDPESAEARENLQGVMN